MQNDCNKDYKGGVSLIKKVIEISTDTAVDAVDYVAYVTAVAQAILASIKKRCIIIKLLLMLLDCNCIVLLHCCIHII